MKKATKAARKKGVDLFIYAEETPGKLRFSSAFLAALEGQGDFISWRPCKLRADAVLLKPHRREAKGEKRRKIHTTGSFARGIVDRELWEKMPTRTRVAIHATLDGEFLAVLP